MPKTLIIIPTYNELNNITRLIPDIFERHPLDLEILIVDDNSPDGTGKYIEEICKTNTKVHIVHRAKKMGLGTAYCEGFAYALKRDYDYIFEMDADYSHDPKEIKNFLNAIEQCDFVIGSRYKTGVNVVNWPMHRLMLSWFANKYTRVITGMKITDSTGGFKCFRRKVLESINLSKIKSNGYAFQIEMNFKAIQNGYKFCEVPIIFIDRHSGHSKMSKKIVREAVFLVWKLRIQSMFHVL
ncbi:MAG: dolichyl-phosphate beta-D-mannosyltransferase [Ignavibacteria bacterium CG22_combo_CG10-13_8_21_14_all_37_15]|nr:polyprenol monophosphomannose synthase [Ignavibacteria bacterium]PIP78391.1 MAG: dolichyl-phosphate beta-D-mannosyltransferase [Ignavibacteria bacterium CG22_combo_CG10-13_8_21_14_all_37_15]PJC57544.1 MAG: dolichyl-phosphate beta-D-mannosyltransferase [Ignavibacteria bacterium CG_4_9_14_0_2_um_filter_37_13]